MQSLEAILFAKLNPFSSGNSHEMLYKYPQRVSSCDYNRLGYPSTQPKTEIIFLLSTWPYPHRPPHISPKTKCSDYQQGKKTQWLHARCLNFFLALAGNFDWQGFDCLCMRTHTPMPSNAAVRQPAWNNVHGDLKVVSSFWFLLSQCWFMGEIIKWRYNKSHNVNVSAEYVVEGETVMVFS